MRFICKNTPVTISTLDKQILLCPIKNKVCTGGLQMDEKTTFLKVALANFKDFIGAPAPLVPFADWDYYYTKGVVDWRPSDPSTLSIAVKIPVGFVTDLASIPRPFWSILPPQGRYAYPAVVHDYLYWEQPCDRATADLVLKLAMQEMEVGEVKVQTIYNAVRLAGQGAWSSNAEAKAKGESRITETLSDRLQDELGDLAIRPRQFPTLTFVRNLPHAVRNSSPRHWKRRLSGAATLRQSASRRCGGDSRLQGTQCASHGSR
jgi:hypothetical protein